MKKQKFIDRRNRLALNKFEREKLSTTKKSGFNIDNLIKESSPSLRIPTFDSAAKNKSEEKLKLEMRNRSFVNDLTKFNDMTRFQSNN